MCQWVYPRVCGGTPQLVRNTVSGIGLSPRVRGNRLTGTQPSSDQRSIPACAGEPSVSSRVTPGFRVYPRVCGGTDWIVSWPVVT